jgi:hypothetical protein
VDKKERVILLSVNPPPFLTILDYTRNLLETGKGEIFKLSIFFTPFCSIFEKN